ncbi:hypothetical protein MVLG_03089 [Microbotryum lychnidis-dioicae p1A1 Lamole]|uniref:Heme haloperoxidase family profile domain-containing protein n=1 Tax=Microbotryum lychnidis-dioicae (strain p1A1 Lamole / MvSl-1064) TaxID=683840 RepID=U5H750_USTV1|nr:hypothetical protein MVLG_03089 [Microbotryum lychnidis-dioicae p1A1 Lamole]|eukprot:KDE06593.1 hypothetical protein MVLG_03089 [Microbotryum lychnidis-dioicae p1A1 Lamole]
MRITFAVTATLSAVTTLADAYPHIAEYLAERNSRRQAIPTVPFPKIGGVPRVLPIGFNADAQRVSTTGDHAFIAPGPNDRRGPCAGLNAAANHGYLPRDGIATYAAVETGLWEAFGLDQTATQVLQQTTTFFDGDPITQKWSIGGFSPKTAALAPVGDLLGLPLGTALSKESGICGYGHLKSEGDASITRGDFLAPTMNSNCASYPKFFQELLDTSCEVNKDCLITMDSLALHQHRRKLYSINTNPNYFSPAFAGVVFTPAAHHFVFALMANRSSEHPEGLLTPEALMQWFSYSRDGSGKLVYKYGNERIPDNFYKRGLQDPWTLPDILTGVVQQCLAYPTTCAIGGNTGKVNSFAGVEVGDLSHGLYDSSAFTDPAKLGCFLSMNIQAEAPSFLSNVLQGPVVQTVLSLLTSTLIPTLAKGFGECNGINVKGGNGAGVPFGQYSGASQFPGAVVQNDGPRGMSPSP